MKRFAIIGLLGVMLPLLAFKREKCDSEALYSTLVKKLGKYTLLKDYRVYQKKKKKSDAGEMEYFNISLNRGVKYKFSTISSADYDGKLAMNLYNNPGKEFLFASTYNKATGLVKESIEFKCQTTGTFCVGFYYIDGLEGCGVAVSAFQNE